MKGHNTAPTNPTELWTSLGIILQVIPIDCFQKLVEAMLRCVAAVIKARGDPSRYSVGIPNSVALQCIFWSHYFQMIWISLSWFLVDEIAQKFIRKYVL